MLRASDTVGRLGGDEFVILAEGISLAGGPSWWPNASARCSGSRSTSTASTAFPITVTASIGIATGDRATAQELLRDADIALYQAKAAGRDG